MSDSGVQKPDTPIQTTDEQVLATKHMRPTQAQKRLGYKTLPAYLRRLAVAEANKAKEAPTQAPEAGKEDA